MALIHREKPVIAFVSNNCWSLYNFRLDILSYFVQEGHRVLMIAPRDEFTEKLLEALPVVYHEVNFRNSAVSPLHDFRLYRQLCSIYREELPDIIFHYVTKPVIYGSLAAGKLGIPSIAVITGLGYVYASNSWLSWPVSFLFRRALRRVAQVWFLNRENAGFFTGEKIIPPGKSRILPGEGINTLRFSPVLADKANQPFVFLMASRLLWSKGVGTFMEAAAILRKKGIVAEYRLVGKPEQGHPESVPSENIKQWVADGLLTDLGFSDQVETVLAKADCFVLPTYYEEGIPRSLMEASSMELPVITSDHTGCNSVVEHGVTGLLCRPRDAADLAEKMCQVISLSDGVRQAMGKAGRAKMIREFDTAHVIRIYQETVQRYQG